MRPEVSRTGPGPRSGPARSWSAGSWSGSAPWWRSPAWPSRARTCSPPPGPGSRSWRPRPASWPGSSGSRPRPPPPPARRPGAITRTPRSAWSAGIHRPRTDPDRPQAKGPGRLIRRPGPGLRSELPGEDPARVVPPLPPRTCGSRVPGQREGTGPVLSTGLGPGAGHGSPSVDGSGEGPGSLDGTGRIAEAERDVVPVDRSGDRPRGRVVRIGQRSAQAAAVLLEGHAVGVGGALVNGLDLVAAVQVPLLPRERVAVWRPGTTGVCRGTDGRCARDPGPACHEPGRGRKAQAGS